jgi:hypothetical protein
MQHRALRSAGLALVFVVAASAAAAAQEAPPGDPFDQVESLTSAVLDAEVVAPGSLTFGMSSQTLTATNSGNSVTAETIENGDIVLSSDAFSGFSGIGNFVMNTGNNNNLQGSIGVVVIITPPPTQ